MFYQAYICVTNRAGMPKYCSKHSLGRVITLPRIQQPLVASFK
jgi:hypothetical protein